MTEIYGTDKATFEDAKDKLLAKLNTLITVMASGYDPKLSYAYDHHDKVPIQLNGASIQFASCKIIEEGLGEGATYQYQIAYSLRVHTAYQGQYFDANKTMRLMNSIDNYLHEERDLENDYDVWDIDDFALGQDFKESATQGGSMTITIRRFQQHIKP